MKITKTKTGRGFSLIEFKDRYDIDCTIQKSSLATENAIWFGAKEIGLRQMSINGWEDVKLEGDPIANNRMHLTQDQVKSLLPTLQRFADTGEI